MPEVKHEVKPIEVNYVCDACGNGMMEAIGEMDKASGEWEHQCLICDHKQVFRWQRYPRIEHIGVEDSF
jgi:hypothetical protein